MTADPPVPPPDNRRFELFKFYEEAAQRAKTDAWTQTSWVLTLSGAALGFSINLYVKDRACVPQFAVITWACATAGVILSAYVLYVLHQLAKHIRTYWTASNRLAAPDQFLKTYISPKDAIAALTDDYKGAPYPPFIVRLFLPPIAFAVGHVAWAWYVGT
jgi:hypothetical protein